MAEAEDVITDVARHATVFAQDLWRRHRPAPAGPAPVRLADSARRLDLLIAAVFMRSFPLRVAQEAAAPTWLSGIFRRGRLPPPHGAVPATDGHCIWLPAVVGPPDAPAAAAERLRTMALQQAMRAARGSAAWMPLEGPLALRELYLLLEARAADDALARVLPGLAAPLARLRQHALSHRPALNAFASAIRAFELLARAVLGSEIGGPLPAGLLTGLAPARFELPASPPAVLEQARLLHGKLSQRANLNVGSARLLWRDAWTGDLRSPPAGVGAAAGPRDDAHDDGREPRSARLARRPEVREEVEGEDDRQPGAWMVQPAPPHEQAEDPMGLQRPTDRDAATAAEEFADAVSELPEARLVSVPGKPREVLMSDDPPETRVRHESATRVGEPACLHYPEWDWRAGAYRLPGATVLLLPAGDGPQQWVDRTLAQRAGMLHEIRRRFELLRAQRVRVRKQLEGDEADLQAWIDGQADFRSGLSMTDRLYQSDRRSRRDMAIMLLIDVSGSTDGWIAAERRIIDVEREALLLVCVALEGIAEPYSVLAFSGEGPQHVVVRSVKRFDERYGGAVSQRIAGLEPEHYTRAGAAIRHASTLLMREQAGHRLLLLLSDGKPNDVDAYDGRYGVEDMRQAVTEARLQGVSLFCLTIDRQASSYLPGVFGPHQYALLPRPELLPVVLLEWLRRLMVV
jgi:nitric oxide reductase NorD protein